MLALFLAPTMQDPSMGMEKQVEMRMQEAQEAGAIYAALFTAEPSADLWAELGQKYIDQSKPIQAIAIFKQALKVDGQHKEARAGLEQAEIDYNRKMDILENQQKAKGEALTPQDVCSRAAILFHLGYEGDAFAVLSQAIQKFGQNWEITGLKQTFQRGLVVDASAMKTADAQFKGALERKDREAAMRALGEWTILALGRLPLSEQVDRLVQTFPDLDRAKISAVLATTPQIVARPKE
jgi:tetratricopeptide (TPR) repeat protein